MLARAVASVLAQTEKRLVVRVFDNASTDDTPERLEKITSADPRVLVHRHSSNIGSLSNFRFALASVNTPYFSILSDDDVVGPYLYARALEELTTHPETAAYFSDVLHVTDCDKVTRRALQRWPSGCFVYPAPNALEAMTTLGRPEWTGAVFRTEPALERGLLREDAWYHSDVEFTLRVVAHHAVVVDGCPGAAYSVGTAHRSPYPIAELHMGCEALAREIRSWPTIAPELADRAAAVYTREMRSGPIRRHLAYELAGMLTDADRFLASYRHDPQRQMLRQCALEAIAIASRTPVLRSMMRGAVRRKRELTRRQLPMFDAEYCQREHVPLSLLEAWKS
jgi:glycosyltransferase involved in cell wall biosynthesis